MPHKLFSKIRSSMSAKVAIIVTLPVVLVVAFQSYFQYTATRKLLFQNTEIQLRRIAESLRPPLALFLIQRDYYQVQSLIVESAKGSDIELIALYDPQETVLASNKVKWLGRSAVDMQPDDVTDNDLAAIKRGLQGGYSIYYDPLDDQYCLVMPMILNDEAIATLHISLDVGGLQAAVERDAIERFVFSLLAVVAIGTTIFALFHHYFTRRIQSVSTAAIKLASGDMAARADEKGMDEIGHLAVSFNTMTEGIAIWRNNLEQIAANRTKELSALYEVVDTVSKSLDLSVVLPNVLERVTDNLGAGKGAIVLVKNDGKTLALMAQQGLSEEGADRISRLGQGCVGDVIRRNGPIRAGGVNAEKGGAIPGLEQEYINSALVVPITARGDVVGVLAVYSERNDAFSEQDEALLATIGNQVGVAVENARLYEKTLELAQADGLTGLANRRHLMERLKQEMDRADRYQTSLSIIFIDLDKFKSFNDTYGHPKGDELLKAFSTMVRRTIRTADLAGRYGGEEFCILLPNTSAKGAQVIAERLRAAMENLTIFVGDDLPLCGRTISVGIAEFSPGDSLEKLISRADAALYRAKEGGRNRVAL